jgi:hypothetical protein
MLVVGRSNWAKVFHLSSLDEGYQLLDRYVKYQWPLLLLL